MISVKNLYKNYVNKSILNNISLTIPKYKITALIGPNGAGKSTLLNVISRLSPMDRGEVYLEERPLAQWGHRELAKKLAILKQANHLTLRITVEELVSFGRFPYSQGRLNKNDKKYIHQALDYMDLLSLKTNFISELSGGQRQRAFIAMTIVQDTDYIFLDEPLNNLDIRHSVNIMKTLKKLVTELNKTIVIVMHDINFAATYADYLIALKEGELLYQGKTNKIIDASTLENVFDTPIAIKTIDSQRYCLYFS